MSVANYCVVNRDPFRVISPAEEALLLQKPLWPKPILTEYPAVPDVTYSSTNQAGAFKKLSTFLLNALSKPFFFIGRKLRKDSLSLSMTSLSSVNVFSIYSNLSIISPASSSTRSITSIPDEGAFFAGLFDRLRFCWCCYIGKRRSIYQAASAAAKAHDHFMDEYAGLLESLANKQRNPKRVVHIGGRLKAVLQAREAWLCRQQTMHELLEQEKAAGHDATFNFDFLPKQIFPDFVSFFDLCKAQQVLLEVKRRDQAELGKLGSEEAAQFVDEILAILDARVAWWQGSSKIRRRSAVRTCLVELLGTGICDKGPLPPRELFILRQASRVYRLWDENESRFLYHFLDETGEDPLQRYFQYKDFCTLRASISIYKRPGIIGEKLSGRLKNTSWWDLKSLYFFAKALDKQLTKVMRMHAADRVEYKKTQLKNKCLAQKAANRAWRVQYYLNRGLQPPEDDCESANSAAEL